MPPAFMLFVGIGKVYENQRFQVHVMFDVLTCIRQLSQMIGNAMQNFYSIMNICMRSDLQVTTGHFETLRYCGPMKRRVPWGNPLVHIFEIELQNGCGLALNAEESTREHVGVEAVIVAAIAKSS